MRAARSKNMTHADFISHLVHIVNHNGDVRVDASRPGLITFYLTIDGETIGYINWTVENTPEASASVRDAVYSRRDRCRNWWFGPEDIQKQRV
ncbi:hypothetical protein AURDEDRAFT_165201 [Auricularia subglabra TFB-10046 SS5]|nr:hypothetical protein AURDEDRAFT_165201 [Auricularia subglabra TFB-10046 SS5]